MRFDIATVLLLPSAVAANILENIFAHSDATTTATSQSTSAPLNRAFEATGSEEMILAIQTSSPNPGHLGRSYNPNPNLALFQAAFALEPAPASSPAAAKREIVTGAAQGVAVTASVGAQVPAVTTAYPETMVNGKPEYLPVVYTQTFAQVPEQWPSPGVGTIGYGPGASGQKKEKKRGDTETREEMEKRESGSAVGLSVKLGAVVGAAALVGLALL